MRHGIPAEWVGAALTALETLGASIAPSVKALVAAGVETMYGFAQAGNGIDDEGNAKKQTWTATATLPDGSRRPLIGVNPIAATNPRDVFIALLHGLLLETCRPFAKVTGEQKDASGKIIKAGRLTLYGEAFSGACKGVLDSPRKTKKDGTPGKFAGSMAFLPSPELEAILPEIVASLPPLPYYVAVDKVTRTTVNLLAKSPSGRAWRTTVRTFNADDADSVKAALECLAAFEKDGMTPVMDNEPTSEWFTSVQTWLSKQESADEESEAA